jgi:hypothetical protein
MGATCSEIVTFSIEMCVRLLLHTSIGQVQAEQQATLDAAVLAAHAAKVKAAAEHEAAGQREANLQVKAAAAAKAHAEELEVARQKIAQLEATAVREAAPPGAAFRASGAGSVKCNGWYKQFGTYSGKPRYYKVGDLDTCLLNLTTSIVSHDKQTR